MGRRRHYSRCRGRCRYCSARSASLPQTASIVATGGPFVRHGVTSKWFTDANTPFTRPITQAASQSVRRGAVCSVLGDKKTQRNRGAGDIRCQGGAVLCSFIDWFLLLLVARCLLAWCLVSRERASYLHLFGLSSL